VNITVSAGLKNRSKFSNCYGLRADKRYKIALSSVAISADLLLNLAGFLIINQGCQIGYFMANFKKSGHFRSRLAMKKRIWPFCKIW